MNTHPGTLGRKLGMTQIYTPDGSVLRCTVIQAGATIVGKRTEEKDGYIAHRAIVSNIQQSSKTFENWHFAMHRRVSILYQSKD